LAISAEHPFDGTDTALRYDTAAAIAMQLLALLPNSGHLVLNLNVPRCSLEEVAGVQAAPLSTVTSFHSQVEERTDSVLKIRFAASGEAVPDGSDAALITAGFATVSSLVGVGTVECGDLITRLAETNA